MSSVSTTAVVNEVFEDLEFKDPAKWYIVDCMGDRMYIHKRSRQDAQEAVDEMYGKGKYKIRTAKVDKTGGNLSAMGSATRRK